MMGDTIPPLRAEKESTKIYAEQLRDSTNIFYKEKPA
jgi:hypothetical protein